MNAQEMLAELYKPEVCEGLDEWLRTKLLTAMKNSSNMSVNMSSSVVPWPTASFIRAMGELGYSVSHECEDRPCATPYLKISIRITIPR